MSISNVSQWLKEKIERIWVFKPSVLNRFKGIRFHDTLKHEANCHMTADGFFIDLRKNRDPSQLLSSALHESAHGVIFEMENAGLIKSFASSFQGDKNVEEFVVELIAYKGVEFFKNTCYPSHPEFAIFDAAFKDVKRSLTSIYIPRLGGVKTAISKMIYIRQAFGSHMPPLLDVGFSEIAANPKAFEPDSGGGGMTVTRYKGPAYL